jgi:hypothetical protein
MAKFRYFADIAGQSFELSCIEHVGTIKGRPQFKGYLPGVDLMTCKRADKVFVTRAIEMKSNPSKHKCDARCTSAKGFRCECECGGKNHGARSGFMCEAA